MKIIDDEEYEKNKSFTIELGEPILLEIGQKHGGCPAASTDSGSNSAYSAVHSARLLRLEKVTATSSGSLNFDVEIRLFS